MILIAIDTITEERDDIPGGKKSANHNYLTLSINSLYCTSDMVKGRLCFDWLLTYIFVLPKRNDFNI